MASHDTNLPVCDWRISIVNCKDSEIFLIIQYIALVFVVLALLAALGTLFQRVVWHGGRLWTSSGVSSTESLLALIAIHFIGRIATHFCLIYDVLSPTSISLLWEIPWLVGEVGLQLFFVGVATVSSQTRKRHQANDGGGQKTRSMVRLPTKAAIYTAVYLQLGIQITTNVVLAYFAGRYDYTMEVTNFPWHWFHISHYTLWSVYLMLLSAAFLYYASTLMRALENTFQDSFDSANDNTHIRKQIEKLRLQCLAIGVIYGSFSLILGTFAWSRHLILSQTVISVVLCLGWNTLVPSAILVFCWVTLKADMAKQRRSPSKRSTTGGTDGTYIPSVNSGPSIA